MANDNEKPLQEVEGMAVKTFETELVCDKVYCPKCKSEVRATKADPPEDQACGPGVIRQYLHECDNCEFQVVVNLLKFPRYRYIVNHEKQLN